MSDFLLPENAMFDILVRLPVKALCKFRCVSKAWHALISDPFFLKSHQKQSERNPRLVINGICDHELGNTRLTSLDMQGNVVSEIVKSVEHEGRTLSLFTCLDLVCMYQQEHVYLCNPTTCETFLVPDRSSKYFGTNGIYALAFGYLPRSEEYKILSIFNLNAVAMHKPSYLVCELMTIRKEGNHLRIDDDSCSWREVERPPFVDIGYYHAVVNGAFHVMPYYEYNQYGCYDNHWIGNGIGRFDLVGEEWSLFPPPPELSVVSRHVCLGETWGKLFLADVVEVKYIDMWMLEEYHSGSWVKKYKIDMSVVPTLSSWTPPLILYVVPRAVMEDGRILLEHEKRSLQYYDPKTNTAELVNVLPGELFTSSLHVESFVSFGC